MDSSEGLTSGQCLEHSLPSVTRADKTDLLTSKPEVLEVNRLSHTETGHSMNPDSLQRWLNTPKSIYVTSHVDTTSMSRITRDKDDSEQSEIFSTATPKDVYDSQSKSETLRTLHNSTESNSGQNATNHTKEITCGCHAVDTAKGKSPTRKLSLCCAEDVLTGSLEECQVQCPHVDHRPQSLTEDLLSLSSQKNVRRSGIPSRKLSDHTVGSHDGASVRSSPVHSPHSLRRSLTLNSADLVLTNSLNSLSVTSDYTTKSSSSPQSTGVDMIRKTPSFHQPGVVEWSGQSYESRKSPCSSHSVNCFPAGPCCGTTGNVASWDLDRWEGRGGRCETMSVFSASNLGHCGLVSRDTVTSRQRIERRHQDHDHQGVKQGGAGGATPGTYLTPTQRKELAIRDLKSQVLHLTRQLEVRELQLQEITETELEQKEQLRTQLCSQIKEARGLAEAAQKEMMSLQESHGESVKMVAALQQQLADARKEMTDRLAQAEKIFLEMYNKGRESAIFEREEELELQGKDNHGMNATEAELRKKLIRTQMELAKWQTLQRHDSYHTTPFPTTEAETTLAFLKDSMFHFLTSEKTETSDEHLRAVLSILKFSRAEREKIAEAILTRRNKNGLHKVILHLKQRDSLTLGHINDAF